MNIEKPAQKAGEGDPFLEIRSFYFSLHPLTDRQWDEYIRRFRLVNLKKGAFLIQDGRMTHDVFFIRRGLLISYFQTHSKRTIRGFFMEGEFVADYSAVLRQRPATTMVEALEDCELVALSRESMQELYGFSPVMERIGRLIAERLFILFFDRIRDFYTKPVLERYDDLLATHPNLVHRVPQHMIASFLGVTPEALSRLRRKRLKLQKPAQRDS